MVLSFAPLGMGLHGRSWPSRTPRTAAVVEEQGVWYENTAPIPSGRCNGLLVATESLISTVRPNPKLSLPAS